MIESLFFLFGIVIVGLFLFFIPNQFSKMGKTTILLSSFLLAGFALMAKNVVTLWQVVLVIILLSFLVAYLLQKKIGKQLSKQAKPLIKPEQVYLEEEVIKTLPAMEEKIELKETNVPQEINKVFESEPLKEEKLVEDIEEEFLSARAEVAATVEKDEVTLFNSSDEDELPELTQFQEVKETHQETRIDNEELELYEELYKDKPTIEANELIEKNNDTEIEIEELVFGDRK
ncbi:hypothetical protein [Bacillus sp. AK128]